MPDRKLFVSLPVRHLERSVDFFSKLGFEFDPQFSSDTTACIVINRDTRVMLAETGFFKTLTEREVCDTRTHLQALFALSCESRAEVDALVGLAVDNGGQRAGDPQDHGFMYDWSFYDLDGHGWGVAWMDPNAAPAEAP